MSVHRLSSNTLRKSEQVDDIRFRRQRKIRTSLHHNDNQSVFSPPRIRWRHPAITTSSSPENQTDQRIDLSSIKLALSSCAQKSFRFLEPGCSFLRTPKPVLYLHTRNCINKNSFRRPYRTPLPPHLPPLLAGGALLPWRLCLILCLGPPPKAHLTCVTSDLFLIIRLLL